MASVATWTTPRGVSANQEKMIVERISHYRFNLAHTLADGTKVIPHVTTVRNVINVFDQFGPDIPLAVDEGSYDVYEEES